MKRESVKCRKALSVRSRQCRKNSTKKGVYKEGKRITVAIRKRISYRLLQDSYSGADFSVYFKRTRE